MTDMLATRPGSPTRGFGRQRRYKGYNTAHPPTDEEVGQQTEEQRETAPLSA